MCRSGGPSLQLRGQAHWQDCIGRRADAEATCLCMCRRGGHSLQLRGQAHWQDCIDRRAERRGRGHMFMSVQKRRSVSSIERPSALAGGAKTPDHDVLTSFWLHKWPRTPKSEPTRMDSNCLRRLLLYANGQHINDINVLKHFVYV
jgi:hypothetical protein